MSVTNRKGKGGDRGALAGDRKKRRKGWGKGEGEGGDLPKVSPPPPPPLEAAGDPKEREREKEKGLVTPPHSTHFRRARNRPDATRPLARSRSDVKTPPPPPDVSYQQSIMQDDYPKCNGQKGSPIIAL